MLKNFYIKFLFTLLLFSVVVISDVRSQSLEVGILAGGSYYYGDIVNEWEPSTISGAGGVFLRYHINENVALKFFGGYCRIGGADSNSKGSSYQRNRNLAFWADVYEGSVQVEYSFVKDITRGRRLRNRFIPYVFAGLGAFWFNDYANDPLSPAAPAKLWQLGTSGKIYNQFSVCIPFGAGVRYKITSNFSLGLELGIRYTFTSWLDDVGGPSTSYLPQNQLPVFEQTKRMADRSVEQQYLYSGRQRGKISINDIYVMGGLTMAYRFGTTGGGGGYRGRAIKCPRFY